MSKCFILVWNTRSSERVIVALLSHNKSVEDGKGNPMLDNRVQSQIASFEASKSAVYFALQGEVATMRWH